MTFRRKLSGPLILVFALTLLSCDLLQGRDYLFYSTPLFDAYSFEHDLSQGFAASIYLDQCGGDAHCTATAMGGNFAINNDEAAGRAWGFALFFREFSLKAAMEKILQTGDCLEIQVTQVDGQYNAFFFTGRCRLFRA